MHVGLREQCILQKQKKHIIEMMERWKNLNTKNIATFYSYFELFGLFISDS